MKRSWSKEGFFSQIALVVLLFCLLLAFCVHFYKIRQYNNEVRVASQGDKAPCTISFYPRGGIADSWEKRDIPFNGQIVTFTGTTYDCAVENMNSAVISDWKLKISISEECYINNSWCGTVEIHQQQADGSVLVQELDLRDYRKDEIALEHFYVAADLYIPLKNGDFIEYNPSEISGELPVPAFNETPGKTVIGFIFYHLKGMEPHFYCSMSYRLTRGYFQGSSPKILLTLFALWIMLFIVRLTFVLTFSNLRRESNLVIRAISGMYANLYKVNLSDDTFQEIRATELMHGFFEKHLHAQAALKEAVPVFYSDDSRAAALTFYDTSLWKERLKETDMVSAVLKSADLHGAESARWYRTNLIVCKRTSKNEPVEVICGILDVDAEVREREESKLMMERFATDLSHEVAEQTLHIQEIQKRVVASLGDMIGSRDGNTGGHVKRTSDVVQIFVSEIVRRNAEGHAPEKFARITEKMGEAIIRAAPMHDLGKIFIDTNILCKPGKLTDAEYAVMKTHASHSGDIVNLILRDVEEQSFVDIAYNVARYHHERWDGRGYPEGSSGGKSGEGIPLEARIMAVADVYDALVSKRCYKEPFSFEQAFTIMLDGMGSQFDPDMKDIFIACRAQLEQYYREQA